MPIPPPGGGDTIGKHTETCYVKSRSHAVTATIHMVILFSGKKNPPSALTADGASPKDGMAMSPHAQIIFADMHVTHPAATAICSTIQCVARPCELALKLGLC